MAGRITADRVAEMLGVSLRTVQLLTARGEIPAAKIGRRWMYRPEAVTAFEEEREACQKNASRRQIHTGAEPFYGLGSRLGDASIAKAYEQARQKLLRGASRK